MVDYTLNVAVGISASIAAIRSATPALHNWTLPLCLAVLAATTLLNLRGTREASVMWAIPSYLYIATLACVLISGIVQTQARGGYTPFARAESCAGGHHLTGAARIRRRMHGDDRHRGREFVS